MYVFSASNLRCCIHGLYKEQSVEQYFLHASHFGSRRSTNSTRIYFSIERGRICCICEYIYTLQNHCLIHRDEKHNYFLSHIYTFEQKSTQKLQYIQQFLLIAHKPDHIVMDKTTNTVAEPFYMLNNYYRNLQCQYKRLISLRKSTQWLLSLAMVRNVSQFDSNHTMLPTIVNSLSQHASTPNKPSYSILFICHSICDCWSWMLEITRSRASK